MSQLNNWEKLKIIKKENILEFDFLISNEFISEIEDEFYYLNCSFTDVEKKFYEELNAELASQMSLKNVNSEITKFIKKLNKFNEAKDIAQSLMGKIADLRNVSIKDIHDELNIPTDIN